MTSTADYEAVRLYALAEDLRSEASIANRPGQLGRLNNYADELDRIAEASLSRLATARVVGRRRMDPPVIDDDDLSSNDEKEARP